MSVYRKELSVNTRSFLMVILTVFATALIIPDTVLASIPKDGPVVRRVVPQRPPLPELEPLKSTSEGVLYRDEDLARRLAVILLATPGHQATHLLDGIKNGDLPVTFTSQKQPMYFDVVIKRPEGSGPRIPRLIPVLRIQIGALIDLETPIQTYNLMLGLINQGTLYERWLETEYPANLRFAATADSLTGTMCDDLLQDLQEAHGEQCKYSNAWGLKNDLCEGAVVRKYLEFLRDNFSDVFSRCKDAWGDAP